MHPQLQDLADQFTTARDRLHRLAADLPAEGWVRRPPSGGWSPAECVAHLNLTSLAYVPQLRGAIRDARSLGGTAPARYRLGLVGWMLWRVTREQGKMKAKTAPDFVPGATAALAELLDEFDRLQDEQMALLAEAEGLPIHRIRLASPFNARMKYNAFAAFSLLPGHQHRHLGQAERAAASSASG